MAGSRLVFVALSLVVAAWADPPAGQPKAVNLALRKPATQSSTYRGTGFAQGAEMGVDGVIAPDKDPQFVFHTQLEANPWWQVDLGAALALGEIHLHNRVMLEAPEVGARARTLAVLLSTDGKAWRPVYQHKGGSFDVLRLPLAGAQARYVRLQLAERTHFHLREVELYATAGTSAPAPVRSAGLARGEVLAEGKLGPAGGDVVAAGKVRLTLPPGALAREEVVRIRQMTLGGKPARIYGFERDGQGLLARPATVSLALPPGTDGSKAVVFHELAGELATVVPARYDPKQRSLVATTLSFSYLGWDTWAKWVNEPGSKAGKWAAGGMLVLLGAAAVTVGAEAVGLAGLFKLADLTLSHFVFTGLMAGGAGLAFDDAVTKYGLDRQITILADPQDPQARFNVAWEGSDMRLRRFQVSAVCDREGRVYGWMPLPNVSDAQMEAIRQAIGTVVGAETASKLGLTVKPVPTDILRMSADLCLARLVLKQMGLDVPARVDVLVRTTGANDAGAWAAPFLNVGPATLAARDADAIRGRQATLLHEYYHAVCHLNKTVNNTYLWLEEAIATSLEAEFLGYEGYFNPDEAGLVYDWPNSAVALGAGFVNRRAELGAREDWSKRGYRLWSWPRYIAHTKGWTMLWRAARDGLEPATVSQWFDEFALSLLTSDRALRDPNSVRRPWGVDQNVKTAWSKRRLADFRGAPEQPLGRLALPPHLAAPRPLSLNVLPLQLGAGTGPLVVRRRVACADEGYWLLPPGEQFPSAPGLQRARGCLVVPPERVGAAGVHSLALVHNTRTAGQASDLLAYRLDPPRDVSFSPAQADAPARLTWSPPDLGRELKPSDLLTGYRLWVRKPGGQTVMLPGVVKGTAGTFEPAVLAGVEAVGVSSEDAVVKAEKDPLRSPVAWVSVAAGKPGGVLYWDALIMGRWKQHVVDFDGKEYDYNIGDPQPTDQASRPNDVVVLQVDGLRFRGQRSWERRQGTRIHMDTYSVDGRFNEARTAIADVTLSILHTYNTGGNSQRHSFSFTATNVPLAAKGKFGGPGTWYHTTEPKLTKVTLSATNRGADVQGRIRWTTESEFRPTGGRMLTLHFADKPWPVSEER